MGQGISCNDENVRSDVNQQHFSPIQSRKSESVHKLEFQDQKTLINQYNNISIFSSQLPSMQKEAHDNKHDIQQYAKYQAANEQKQVIIEEINPLTSQAFHKQESIIEKRTQYSVFLSRNQSKDTLQELVNIPPSFQKSQRPSSNCKLSTRVQEKYLDIDEDECLALNFSPSNPISSRTNDQGFFPNTTQFLNPSKFINTNPIPNKENLESGNQTQNYSHQHKNSNEVGFRYLQSGINQLNQSEQYLRGSFGINKPPLTTQLQNITSLQQKFSYSQIEESSKISKRYDGEKENAWKDEKLAYQYNQRYEIHNNLEQFKILSQKSSLVEDKQNQKNMPVSQKANEYVDQGNTININNNSNKLIEDNYYKYTKNEPQQQIRQKSLKKHEITSKQRTLPTKLFKEDISINKKQKVVKKKQNQRHHSSSQDSSPSSQPSLSSHDSFQNDNNSDRNIQFQYKNHKNKSQEIGQKEIQKNKHILSKKASEQQSNIPQITLNEENCQCCTAPHSNFNSNQPQYNTHNNHQINHLSTEEIQRFSSRSTVTPHQHHNSQCSSTSILQNPKSCSIQPQVCSNAQCFHNSKDMQAANICIGCANHHQAKGNNQIINSYPNQGGPHQLQNKLYNESDGLINRNSNLSFYQSNNSLFGANQFNQFNHIPQQQQFKQYNTQNQLQQIQQQLVQQQLALAQTQQTHQTHIQNILMQQSQQQQQQAIQMLQPYNSVYSNPNQTFIQNHITHSNVIGNYQHHNSIGNQNQIQLYQPHGFSHMATPQINNHGFQNKQENGNLIQNHLQENVLSQQINQLYPSVQSQYSQQYLIHPSASSNQQQLPIIINNNVMSPKRGKNKDFKLVNENRNIIQSNEISDDKLRNMQSLSFNINSSQSDDIRDIGKKFEDHQQKQYFQCNNKVLETSNSEIDNKQQIQMNGYNQKKDVQNIKNQILQKNYIQNNEDDDESDIYIANEGSTESIGQPLQFKDEANANIPLTMQTRNNQNTKAINRSPQKDKGPFLNKRQGKNQSLMNSNFDDIIKNTFIEPQNDNTQGNTTLVDINFSSSQQNQNQSKSLAEIFQEKRKKLASKMNEQKRCQSYQKIEEKGTNNYTQAENFADDTAADQSVYQVNKVQGKRSKDDIIKLRQEMKEYGNRVNPKLKAKTQSKIKSEQEQLNQEQINGTQRMKSPSYSQKRDELMIRLAQGIKSKISEKEMYALTKKNYENLPEVKKKRQEQEKQNNKLEMLKIKQEKLKELDEKRRSKFKTKSNSQNFTNTKSFYNNYSSNQLIMNE